MQIVEQSAELWEITPAAEELIEQCGRVAHQSQIEGPSAESLIKKLIKWGHLSVLEHASATISFVTDRGVSHELVRHRLCAFTQESTRYCRYEHGIRVIRPPGVGATWKDAVYNAEQEYLNMLVLGTEPQIARAVLPTCLATQIVVTANLRQWRHMFSLRLDERAHPQIREVMFMALKLLKAECPNVFS